MKCLQGCKQGNVAKLTKPGAQFLQTTGRAPEFLGILSQGHPSCNNCLQSDLQQDTSEIKLASHYKITIKDKILSAVPSLQLFQQAEGEVCLQKKKKSERTLTKQHLFSKVHFQIEKLQEVIVILSKPHIF